MATEIYPATYYAIDTPLIKTESFYCEQYIYTVVREIYHLMDHLSYPMTFWNVMDHPNLRGWPVQHCT